MLHENEVRSVAVYEKGLKAGPGHLILKIDHALKDTLETKSLVLRLDVSFKYFENLRISAIVEDVCDRILPYPLKKVNDGFPTPLGRLDKEGKRTCTTHEPEYVTADQQPQVVEKGDTAYIHYLTLRPQNYLGKDADGMELYKCPYENLFGVVRKDGLRKPYLHTLNAYVAVSPYWSPDLQEIEVPTFNAFMKKTGTRKMMVRMTRSGIVIDVNNKPVFSTGIIRYSGHEVGGVKLGLKPGTRVIYLKHSEFKNEILGEDMFLMRFWDICGYYDGGALVPAPGYVMIEEQEEEQAIISTKKSHVRKGRVIHSGSGLVEEGDIVSYRMSDAYSLTLDSPKVSLVSDNQLFMKWI